jgi:hypothetical protein
MVQWRRMRALPRVCLIAVGLLVSKGCSQPSARPTTAAADPPKALPDAGTGPDSRAVMPSDSTNNVFSLIGARRLPSSVTCEPRQLPAPATPLAPPDGGVLHRDGGVADGGVADGGTGQIRRANADKEVIRRIIRRHIDAIKTCYEAALTWHPTAGGAVRTRFLISNTGKVISSCVMSTTLNEAEAERCIADEVLTWSFPKPLGGGVVVVEYPFVLTPGEQRPD